MADLATQMRDWIGSDGAVSIELPERWFGRPMDNRHSLTWAASEERRTVLEFDGQLALLIVGPGPVAVEGSTATITAEHIVFDWRAFGSSGAYSTEIYDHGFVRLHRH